MPIARAEPVAASTVILVRDGFPWKCFMVRRHIRSDFAAGVFVFPGGKVDPGDSSEETLAHVGISTAHRPPDVALRVAAIRELFEEVGILLARDTAGAMVRLEGESGRRFVGYREDLHAGEISLRDIAERESVVLAIDTLVPFSRWITPEELPRRFDTWFYVARLPHAQEPLHDRRETSDGTWIAPEEALHRFRCGKFPLVFATQAHLERMSRFEAIEEMIEACGSADLRPVVPRMVREGDDVRFVLPGGAA